MIPYGKQSIDEDDIQAVIDVLRSDFLTTGPTVAKFEQSVISYCGARYGTAVCNGTAALHAAMFALNIGPGSEVIVPPMTFAATANCVFYVGAMPVFADVEPNTLLIDPIDVERKITDRTRAIIGVDYAGQPCDWDALHEIAKKHELKLLADSCHALGAEYKGRKVGSLADLTVFSFHPVKQITTGEGGMVVTDHEDLDARMKRFRTHGISTTAEQRENQDTWHYEMVDLGFNYRITDIQCALGISQMRKIESFLARRHEIAAVYDDAFASFDPVRLLTTMNSNKHAHHLYVIRVDASRRTEIFKNLRTAGVGVNVHYIPVHFHPYYRTKLCMRPGRCPNAEFAYSQIISLPIWPKMSKSEVQLVIDAVRRFA